MGLFSIIPDSARFRKTRREVRFIGQLLPYTEYGKKERGTARERSTDMRGYFTASGYYGLVDGRYLLFASESEYYEMMNDAA